MEKYLNNIILESKCHNVANNDMEVEYLVMVMNMTAGFPERTYRCFKYWDSALIYVLTNYIEPIEHTIVHKGQKELKYKIEKEDYYQDLRTYTIRDPEEQSKHKWLLRIKVFPIEHYDDYDYIYSKTPWGDR